MKKRPRDVSAGKRLAEIRRHRSLKQRELAKAIRVKTPSVQNWERGRRGISTETLALLAPALDCTRADLMATPGSPIPPPLSARNR